MPRPARSPASTLACALTLGLALANWTRPAFAQDAKARLLVLTVDAAPYDVVAGLMDPSRGDDALFRDLHPPRPLISTFPSTTSLAFGGILEPLGVEPSPGYEAKFYDRQRDEIRGGGMWSYRKIEFPWRQFWDWQLKGLWRKLWGGALPLRKARRLIRPSLEAFAASDKGTFFVYYTTTDLVSHLQGPDALAAFFAELDAELRTLRASFELQGVDLHTVILSDHGMAGGVPPGAPLKNVRRDLLRQLSDAGFRRTRSLRHDVARGDEVVLVPFGLVSSVAAFTRAGREVDAAEAMARANGIELCATAPAPDPAGPGIRVVQVFGRGGRAEIRIDGDRQTYEIADGDPLGLAEVVEARGPTLRDREWLEATAHRRLPDPIHRIVRGFELVENPASVLCSCAPGYLFGGAPAFFGARITKGRLRWTHGALDQEASNGFVATDLPGWQPPDRPLRFDEVFTLVDSPR